MTKKDVLDMLWNEPIKVGHWCGFKDLTGLHNEWLKSFLYSDEDQTLQGHRGSFKTTDLALFFSLTMVVYPNITMMLFRKTSGDVAEIMRTISNILRSPVMFAIVEALYGKQIQIVTDTYSAISTNLSTSIKGQSQLTGMGIGTSITGKHADIIVTDDIVNVSDRISKAEREKTKIAYQELQNIKNRGGRFINTGTPWHKDDCFQLMPNIKKYDCYTTGLLSSEQIEDIKSKMTRSLFCANYELRHIASEDVLFDNPNIGEEQGLVEQAKYVHVDAAYGGEDWTAMTIARKYDRKLYVFGKIWHKHVDDCITDMIAWKHRFMAGKFLTEKNADKGYLAKELRSRGERAVTYNENMNKHLKISSYLKSAWNDIYFVQGTDDEYLQMILDYNENAEHDDAPDSLACMVRKLYSKENA